MRKDEEERTLEALTRILGSEKQGKLDRAAEYLYSLEDEPKPAFINRLERAEKRIRNFSDEEWESPDTYAAERLFLEFFVTDQMAEDFNLIARDFFRHEYQNLEKYHELKYVNDCYDENPPGIGFQYIVLNLMFSAYKNGSAFAKAQFQYLYKKYYKKEYNQIKRFRCIERDYLALFFDDHSTEFGACINIARVLTIGEIFDMEISEDCDLFIAYLTEWVEDEEGRGIYGFGIDKEQHDRAEEILLEKFGDDEENILKGAEESEDYMMHVTDYNAFNPAYIFDCEDPYLTLFETYTRALAMYMDVTKRTEFSENEIHLVVMIYRLLSVIVDNADEAYEQMRIMTASPLLAFENEQEPRYDASRVMPREETGKTGKKPAAVQESEKQSPQKDQSLADELDRLRKKVRALEQNEKAYLDTLAKRDRVIRENEVLLEKYREEHGELAALRDHVYRMTEPDEETQKVSLEEMEKSIAPRRIVIIGGHDNWVKKMKTKFPDWSFVSREVSGIADKDIVKNAEMVYFFSDSLAHSVYYRYMNVVREGKVPFGYIHGVNINRNVEQIYQDINM